MPTDHILDRPDDWTQTFWGRAGIQLANLLPYRISAGRSNARVTPWNTLLMEAINGFELGCALSLYDKSLGRSILEKDCTVASPYLGEVKEDWESVYGPIIDDLNRRISACGDEEFSYGNMFPESGPDLNQSAASRVIARQIFRGMILPFLNDEAAEGILVNGMEEPGRKLGPIEGMPIHEMLTFIKHNAGLVHESWVETGEISLDGWLEPDNSDSNDDGAFVSPTRQSHYAIVVLWQYARGCDPGGFVDWSDERWYATEEEATGAFETLMARATDPRFEGKKFATAAVAFRDYQIGKSYLLRPWGKNFYENCECSRHQKLLTKTEADESAKMDEMADMALQLEEKDTVEEKLGASVFRHMRALDIYDGALAEVAGGGSSLENSHAVAIDAVNEFLNFSITGEFGLPI